MNKDPEAYLHTDSEMMISFNENMSKFYDDDMFYFLGVMIFALFAYSLFYCCCRKIAQVKEDRNPRRGLAYKNRQQ
jgi:hypothetical protein